MQHTCSFIALTCGNIYFWSCMQLYAMLTVLVFNDPMSHNYWTLFCLGGNGWETDAHIIQQLLR